jgi:hypothetical protein
MGRYIPDSTSVAPLPLVIYEGSGNQLYVLRNYTSRTSPHECVFA